MRISAAATPTCLLVLALALQAGCASTPGANKRAQSHDVVIYGGTSAAMAAAIQAKRMGKSVVVVSPDKHLGGLTSGGLGWTDSGNKDVVGGISREFYARIKQHYDKPASWKHQKPEDYDQYRKNEDTMWVFEPHVAERTYDAWMKEMDISVVRNAWLDRAKGVKKHGAKITSITTRDGKTYAGKMFIDATYEGDVMAAAGVTYTVGREANAQYGETINGVQTARAHSHQFSTKIDPYWTRGDPKSGLLPRIHDQDPGKDGDADKRIQAYNFRTCLTNVDANRKPFPRPGGYDAKQYELLLRTLLAGSRHVFGKFDPAPNGKTDTNNHGSFSTDNIGMNYDYPDATYERRREIIKEHERYQQGFYYFLCNDARVPEDVRNRMSKWGLSKDEFKDNGNWPHQIYVREARRMVGEGVVTELELRLVKPTTDSVGMGSYNMDSHNVQRYVARDENGKAYAKNEGDLQISPGGPYPISYKALVPKSGECDNLLVPVCVSSSHIAYGSIRMEPVFMVLGQSAATAASMAIDENIPVQKVEYSALKERLLADKQVLNFDRPPLKELPEKKRPESFDPVSLPGVVIDDEHAILTGDWQPAATIGPFVGHGAQHDGGAGKGDRSATFKASLPPGRYEVRLAYIPANNRATNVPVTVRHAGGEAKSTVDQRKTPSVDKLWVSLGAFEFTADKPAVVEIGNAGADGHVVLDAVQFLPAE
jgi:hypothetical protein